MFCQTIKSRNNEYYDDGTNYSDLVLLKSVIVVKESFKTPVQCPGTENKSAIKLLKSDVARFNCTIKYSVISSVRP